MATYTTCDVCGCKTGFPTYFLEIRNATDPEDYIASLGCDLCSNCAKSIKNFIREERKNNEQLDKELE